LAHQQTSSPWKATNILPPDVLPQLRLVSHAASDGIGEIQGMPKLPTKVGGKSCGITITGVIPFLLDLYHCQHNRGPGHLKYSGTM